MRTGRSWPNRLKGQVRETSSADTTLPQPSEGCFLIGALEALSPVWGGCPYVSASVYVQVSDRHKVVQMGSGVYHSGLDQVFFLSRVCTSVTPTEVGMETPERGRTLSTRLLSLWCHL